MFSSFFSFLRKIKMVDINTERTEEEKLRDEIDYLIYKHKNSMSRDYREYYLIRIDRLVYKLAKLTGWWTEEENRIKSKQRP